MTEPNYIMTISVPAEIASETVSSSILQCMVLSGHGKYKRFRGHRRRAEEWLYEVKKREPMMFTHWALS